MRGKYKELGTGPQEAFYSLAFYFGHFTLDFKEATVR